MFELAAFLVGLLFGSFLNVCISRLPRHESIVSPGSHCPQCGKPIRWYDNIPVLSWILLQGRCRDCKTAIPLRYPLVELAVALWFAVVGKTIALYWLIRRPEALLDYIDPSHIPHLDPSHIPHLHYRQIPLSIFSGGLVEVIGIAILGFLLIGLMVTDWQTMTLPDTFTLIGIAIGLFLVCAQAVFLGPNEDQVRLTKHSLHLTSPGGVTDSGNLFLTGPESLIFGRIAAVCGAALLLLIIRWTYKAVRHREGMGLGDVKLIAMIAAFLGFWPAILSLFIGVLLASFYGAFLLIRGRAIATSKLPFGSFLCVGGLVAAMFGNRLIDMYIALLR
jgi:leader peptidase (prepilin peptidase) / N-methyltransferase